jgi:hypothetical protein
LQYGGHFDPSQHVEMSFLRTRRAVVCRVKDPGQGFSLEELRHAAINNRPAICLATLPFATLVVFDRAASGSC